MALVEMHERVNRIDEMFFHLGWMSWLFEICTAHHITDLAYGHWLQTDIRILCFATVATQFIEACSLSHTHVTHAFELMDDFLSRSSRWLTHRLQFVLYCFFCNLPMMDACDCDCDCSMKRQRKWETALSILQCTIHLAMRSIRR